MIDKRLKIPGESIGTVVSTHETIRAAFKANEAFQKRMRESGVKDHVPTKIVTLKVRLGDGEHVNPGMHLFQEGEVMFYSRGTETGLIICHLRIIWPSFLRAIYLTKPVAKADLLAAIHSRLQRAVQQAVPEFKPNFHSAGPLEEVLGLTPRVAETLLWLAQGKTNGEIAIILGNTESTVKKHVLEIFDKLGVETRTAAGLRALEVLSSPAARG